MEEIEVKDLSVRSLALYPAFCSKRKDKEPVRFLRTLATLSNKPTKIKYNI
jgi:hypothetical protein